MVETGLLAAQLAGSALPQSPQSLPAADVKDSNRFQDLISGGKNTGTSIQPQSLDSSVLQFVEPGQTADSGTLVDRMIDQATRIDGNYHSLLDQMGNRPGFDQYLNRKSDEVSTEMLTYPHVDSEQSTTSKYDSAMESIKEVNTATLNYQSDMNTWAMNFRIWSSSVEIVAAAAKKVSTGFQTLFRASG
jgi:hypothetical protein